MENLPALTPQSANITALLELANGRDFLGTRDAAFIINRSSQTLRIWASQGTGRIAPVRQAGRLGWRVADLAKILNGEV